ncbi:MAG: hypothetical protein CVT98_10120, partial [Bacteroidetes bacterium HGW-Bacteroidetes-15]
MKNITFVIIAAMAIGIGCKSSSDNNDFAADSEEMIPMSRMGEVAPSKAMMSDESYSEVSDEIVTEQMIIKTANLNIFVANYEVARTQIDSLVKLYKGSVSSESLYNYDYQISNNISIRVPSESLDKLLSELLTIAQKV